MATSSGQFWNDPESLRKSSELPLPTAYEYVTPRLNPIEDRVFALSDGKRPKRNPKSDQGPGNWDPVVIRINNNSAWAIVRLNIQFKTFRLISIRKGRLKGFANADCLREAVHQVLVLGSCK
jgi:hypothetical protein